MAAAQVTGKTMPSLSKAPLREKKRTSAREKMEPHKHTNITIYLFPYLSHQLGKLTVFFWDLQLWPQPDKLKSSDFLYILQKNKISLVEHVPRLPNICFEHYFYGILKEATKPQCCIYKQPRRWPFWGSFGACVGNWALHCFSMYLRRQKDWEALC